MLYNNLLVVINPEKDHQIALDKAILIAERLGSRITALVRKQHAVPKLLASLDKKLSVACAKGVEVAVKISDERHWFRALIRAQHDGHFDLVIKEPHLPSLADHVFLPDDWKLLRNSRIPVLLARAETSWEQRPVLLCVNANSADSEHQALNTRILETGFFISEVGDTPLHLVSAYPSPMQDATAEAQVPTLLEAQYRAGCQRLLADKLLPDSQLHIDQGPPELLIPQVADRINAKLVVLGTVARTGLSGVLLGNTAEQVIGRLESDLLVLPPEA